MPQDLSALVATNQLLALVSADVAMNRHAKVILAVVDCIESQAAEIARLTAERDALRSNVAGWVQANGPGGWIDALREDAERWRAIRGKWHWEPARDMAPGGRWWVSLLVGQDASLEIAIDSARK